MAVESFILLDSGDGFEKPVSLSKLIPGSEKKTNQGAIRQGKDIDTQFFKFLTLLFKMYLECVLCNNLYQLQIFILLIHSLLSFGNPAKLASSTCASPPSIIRPTGLSTHAL
jgi:hypothetical protein